jgi:small conductance mechanosensitive channel
MPDDQPDWIERLDQLHLLTPLRVLAIVAVAVLLTMAVGVVVRRLMRRTIGLSGSDRPRADARQRALAGVLRSSLVGVIWSMAMITIVSEVGVNIGAFVATATVVGGAIAFGAQTLVRDAISGFFVLAEDQYGVGDQVDLGLASGEVERINLRSVRLRDGEGRVWHVPHGNVARVANLSKSSTAHLDLEVARDSDIAAITAIAEDLGAALSGHPVAGPLLAGEPTVVGLIDVRDDRLVMRVSAPTQPGQHDEVRRTWRLLALQAFADGRLAAPPAPTTVVQIAGDRRDLE